MFPRALEAMTQKITACVEEEFGPFFSLLWRRRKGWRPVLFALRGPGGVFPPLGLVLTALGIWRFARTPRPFLPVQDQFVDTTASRVHTSLGSYGMGGPGFLGIKLGSSWVVFRLWAASERVTLNAQLLEEGYFPAERQAEQSFTSLTELVGATFRGASLSNELLRLKFSKAEATLELELRADGSTVPPWRGNGLPKRIDGRLEDALCVSDTARLWLVD